MQDNHWTPEAQFEAHKPLIFSIAYRMLGTIMDAEDIVQEAYLRWQSAARSQPIDAPKAYLASIATRLSIDWLRSAQHQREIYVGEWLPQPIIGAQPDPADDLDTLSIAFLKVLESLSPAERAVLLLHDVFDYQIDEIAPIVEKSRDNCRQILHRARKAVEARRPRFEVTHEQHEALLGRFVQAAAGADMEGLMALLVEDVVTYSDGGGKVKSAVRPVRTADHVARFMIGLTGHIQPVQSVRFEPVNGRTGIVIYNADGSRSSVTTFDIANGKIRGIYIIRNPDKLVSPER